MNKVLICGSGPAAAFAVMACLDAGITPEVISNSSPKVTQPGAFFLHWLPPEFVEQNALVPIAVDVFGVGTAKTYSLKQWGIETETSFPPGPRTERWFVGDVLNCLWDKAKVQIQTLTVKQLIEKAREYDFIFHTFPVTQDYGRNLTKFLLLICRSTLFGASITYNGVAEVDWIRRTNVGGIMTFEFGKGASRVSVLPPLRRNFKFVWLPDIPLGTPAIEKSEWLAPNIIPVGRYATWNRKVLASDSYNVVTVVLKGELE